MSKTARASSPNHTALQPLPLAGPRRTSSVPHTRTRPTAPTPNPHIVHICADDKSTIAVTDPGFYCGAVPRQRRVIAAQGVTPSVCDHGFVRF
jgi:hypothetical protein